MIVRRLSVALRWVVAALVLGLVSAACTSGNSIESLRRQLESQSARKAAQNVRPPPAANPRLTARVGLILATNSRTWGKLIHAPSDRGVAVLFVQPHGPSDGSGIQQGDVVTGVDGKTVSNAENAVVVLRSRPDQVRSIEVAKQDGTRKTVTVTAKVPGDIKLTDIYAPLINQSPDDPMLRFLRAQAWTSDQFDPAMADVNKAVDLVPGFVEAISLRAELLWNKARDQSLDPSTVDDYRGKAMDDWGLALKLDPRNTRVLVSRAQALAQLDQAASAKRDAELARSEDSTFPGAYNALAVADYVLGKVNEAAVPARTAIDLNPYDVRYYKLLAIIFMRLNRPDDARKTVNAIVDLVEDPATREDLLRVLERATPSP